MFTKAMIIFLFVFINNFLLTNFKGIQKKDNSSHSSKNTPNIFDLKSININNNAENYQLSRSHYNHTENESSLRLLDNSKNLFFYKNRKITKNNFYFVNYSDTFRVRYNSENYETEFIDDSVKLICENNSSCNYHGKCKNSTTCICDPYFVTYFNKEMKYEFIQCNYYQLSKKLIFLVSFFLGPLSFEHLLMGNVLTGIIKLSLPMIIILIGNSVFILGKLKMNDRLQIVGKIFELIATIIIILWWMIDWILILTDIYKDNKNISFYQDF